MSKAEDPLVNCPLDEVHRIRKSRMQTHLVKCLKNHKLGSSSKLKCPFNPLHIVEAVEITYHCQSCPDRASVVLEQFETEGEKCFSGVLSFEELQRRYDEIVPRNNEWEKYTINTTAYDPTANIENRPVFRSLNCESKSKRKAFRLQERRRFAAIDNNLNIPRSVAPEAPPEVIKPIRQPYSFSKNGTTAIKPMSAGSVATGKESSDDIENQVTEPVENKPKKNDEVDVESVTDVLSQLEVVAKAESVIKERRNTSMKLVASSDATNTSRNPISYRDAALFKSNVVNGGTNDGKSPPMRIRTKCAANFNTIGEQ